MPAHKEVTVVAARHIKPGYEAQYKDWMHRIGKVILTYEGFRGMTIIAPRDDEQVWYLVYRFATKEQLDVWQHSKVRQQYLAEVKQYATQHYTQATGMETWFSLHEQQPTPPKWKMALAAFSGVFLIGVLLRFLLQPHIGHLHMYTLTAIYGALTVSTLTWVYMPNFAMVFRSWLYGDE